MCPELRCGRWNSIKGKSPAKHKHKCKVQFLVLLLAWLVCWLETERKRKETRANKRMERIDSQMADVMVRVCWCCSQHYRPDSATGHQEITCECTASKCLSHSTLLVTCKTFALMYDRATSSKWVPMICFHIENCALVIFIRITRCDKCETKKKQMFHFNLDKASSHRLGHINAIATELRTSALLRSVKRSTALCTEDNLA